MELKCSSPGIGDMVCGLYVMQALKEKYPGEEMIYYVLKPSWFKHVRGIKIRHYLKITDPNITNIYVDDRPLRRAKYQRTTRKNLYASQIPLLKIQPTRPSTSVNYNRYGSILLFPWSAWKEREWDIDSWIALETRLQKKYGNVYVLGHEGTDMSMFNNGLNTNNKDALDMLVNARFIVSNDSGMAHLGGLYGIPTLSIINFFSEKYLFSETDVKSIGRFNDIRSNDAFKQVNDMLYEKNNIDRYNMIESKILLV
jgi:ADP-heptose:LPS heptosyltransferase